MSTVVYEVRDHIAYVTLNRPEQRNAINTEMREELFDAFTDVRDNPEVWVAVITGAGNAFSTGHDLKEMGTGKRPTTRTTDELYVFQSTIWKPFIAAINGYCLAQGAGVALCSDIRIASEQAVFGWPQVKRGISSVSGPSLLAHRIPLGRAMLALMTGDFISAKEAYELNLVEEVVPHDSLMLATEELARKICSNAPLSVRAIKEVTIRGLGLSLENRVRMASLMMAQLRTTEDAKEGLAAFAEKRVPVWKGR